MMTKIGTGRVCGSLAVVRNESRRSRTDQRKGKPTDRLWSGALHASCLSTLALKS